MPEQTGFIRECVTSGPGAFQTANFFLYCGKVRSMLIDTGFSTPSSRQVLEDLLEQHHISPNALDIFITHNHPDHAGLADVLQSRGAVLHACPGEESTRALLCRYYEEGADSAAEILRFYGFPEDEALRIWQNTMEPRYRYHRSAVMHAPFVPTLPGTVFRDPLYELEVISLSGHTPGHLGLLDRKNRRLFTGDCIGGKNVFLVSTTKYGERLWERQQKTLQGLLQYDAFQIFPGHGDPFSGLQGPVENTLAYYRKMCQRIRSALDSTPQTAKVLLHRVFGYRGTRVLEEESVRLHFRMANLLTCLEWLTDAGELEFSMQEETAYWKIK